MVQQHRFSASYISEAWSLYVNKFVLQQALDITTAISLDFPPKLSSCSVLYLIFRSVPFDF